MAGKLKRVPVEFQPGWRHDATALVTSAALQNRSGAEVIAAGRWRLK
jgi:hypothetical protein